MSPGPCVDEAETVCCGKLQPWLKERRKRRCERTPGLNRSGAHAIGVGANAAVMVDESVGFQESAGVLTDGRVVGHVCCLSRDLIRSLKTDFFTPS